MQETVLELKNYSVSFDTPDGEVQAVRNVDLTVKKGEILCIVGESGCGKTVMCRSVMKLLPPNAHVKSGEISLCGENITAYKRKKMEKLCGSKVSIGNAPTALIHLYELIKDGRIRPELVIGVPVGFVNVVQSKELILTLEDTPYIVARGRKGGSNIAACICNALIYML